ncbi:MAG: PAS domain S-box protein [Proteobacteria bacterium]|nr:PAS domain S-box protein [Pseudomonadota bacterium]
MVSVTVDISIARQALESVCRGILEDPAELTGRLKALLREHAFDNRSILHPRRLNEIAETQVVSLLDYLVGQDEEAAMAYGRTALREGLGERTVLLVEREIKNYFADRLEGREAGGLRLGLARIDDYFSRYLDGYMREREAGILRDQEQLRRALSSALERQGRELYIKNHAINTSINGVMLADLDDRISYINDAFLYMWGYDSSGEVLGQKTWAFLRTDEVRESPMAFLERLGGGWRGELTAQRRDDSTFVVDISASLIKEPNGQPVGIMYFFIDITERKRVEESVRRLNQELEQRVIERTAELRASLEALQKTQEHLIQSEKMSALGGLVAGVAHEINTPVGIGVTVASFLQQKTKEFSEMVIQERLKRSDLDAYMNTALDSSNMILSNLRRAVNFIQTFKQVAVDQSSEERRQFKLKAYIEDVLFSLRPKLKKTHHTIEVSCPEGLELYSYPGAFSQIITNLVVNSLIHGLEFKDEGQIRFEVTEREDGIRFRYSDDGRGIDAKHLTKVFDPFFTTKRGQGGSGLGLHMVYNQVTQTLGGQIDCYSSPGKGATFDIWIPKAEVRDVKQE